MPSNQQPGHSATSVSGLTPAGVAPSRRLPVIGSIVGIGVGLSMSWAVCSWLHWGTFNSRRFLPVVRAIATGDVAIAARRSRKLEDTMVPDRLVEKPRLQNGLPVLTLYASVASRDGPAIRAAVDRLMHWDDGRSAPRVDSSDAVPGSQMSPSMLLGRHDWCIVASCVAGDWETAIRLSDAYLAAYESFWKRNGGVPEDLATTTFVGTTAGEDRVDEQISRLRLSRALACSGELVRARRELLVLLDDPVSRRNSQFYFRPQALLVLAAVEFRLGDAAAANARLKHAEQEYASPPEMQYGQRNEFALPERPSTLAESYRQWRGLAVGFPPLGPDGTASDNDLSRRVWSVREDDHDFVDDYLAVAAGPAVDGSSAAAVDGAVTTPD